MAPRSRYRRKAPSPEVQALFFNKAHASSAFFNPGQSVVQRQEAAVSSKQEEEKPIQKQNSQKAQEATKPQKSSYRLRSSSEEPQEPAQLPEHLKLGIKAISGIAMDDVRVHYNSPKPLRIQALAYTQGTDIYIAPGQERHLAHEAWHVVQQKQGRVLPTLQTKETAVNDDPGLEQEATNMGQRAIAYPSLAI